MRIRTVIACLLVAGGLTLNGSPVSAATVSSGSCTSTVGSATNVTMTVDTDGVCILQFKNVGSTTWVVPAGITSAEVFIVGGGGAGAWSDVMAQGGGGGGGIAHKSGLSVSGTYTVTVGAGGTGTNSPMTWTSGEASSFSNGSMSITADGGGAGAGWGGAVGFNGGSGGGGHWYNSGNDKGLATRGSASGVTGVTFHGNDGGNSNLANSAGGGGGGASTAGTNGTAGQVGGNGGAGLLSSINGTAVVYGSGGGGIGNNGAGTAGTNAGAGQLSSDGGDGVANTGGGGGAAAFAYRSGHGGSGTVVVRFGPVASTPSNTVLPSVTGTTTNGQVLTASPGTWTGYPNPTLTYRWKRSSTAAGTFSNIPGATGLTHLLTDDDVDSYLRFEVTATNTSGASAALSTATAKVADMVRPTTTTSSTTLPTSPTTTSIAPALQIDVVAPPTTPSPTTTVAADSTLGVTLNRSAAASTLRTSPTTVVPTTTVPPVPTTTLVPPPRIGNVATGEAAAEIGGKPATASVERLDNRLVLQAGPLNATIGVVNKDGAPGVLDSDGNVRLQRGDSVRINASGFEPGSTIDVWLFSNPVRMGSAAVGSDGRVSGTFTVPDNADHGSHRIAIVARTADGEPATLTVGVLVGDWEKSTNIATWLIVLPIILAVGGALALPATRRRRRRSGATV